MVKKLMFSIILSTLFLIGAILIVYKSHTSTPVPVRDYWIVQSTKSIYKFRITIDKDEHKTYRQIAKLLNPSKGVPTKISLLAGKGASHPVKLEDYITKDCKLKIEYKP